MANKVTKWVDKYGEEHASRAQAERADLAIDIADVLNRKARDLDFGFESPVVLEVAEILIRTKALEEIGELIARATKH